MDLYIIIILLLVCCIIGLLIKQRIYNKNIEKIKNQKEAIRLLDEEILEKNTAIGECIKLEAKTKDELTKTQEQVKEYNSVLNKLATEGRKTMSEQLEHEKAARKMLLDKEMTKKEEELYQEYLNKKETFESLLQPLKDELAEYQAKKDATIEALKREQEIKDNLAFHQIQLKPEDITDIAYLNSILHELSNKTAIAKVIYDIYIAQPTKELLNRIVGTEKKSGIYRITNIKTEECYVGQSTDLKARLTQHIRGSLGIQTIADQRVHHAMAELGLQNWTFEILEFCDKADLNNREKYWINYYKSNEYGYNNTRGNN